jgi:hypothetical protein
MGDEIGDSPFPANPNELKFGGLETISCGLLKIEPNGFAGEFAAGSGAAGLAFGVSGGGLASAAKGLGFSDCSSICG